MGRMAANQRVVRHIPDRSGKSYTKTANNGKPRIASSVKYMDEKEKTQLWEYRDGELEDINRDMALATIDQTETKYQHHIAFTTQIQGNQDLQEQQVESTMRVLAESIQARRPDAEIYAMALHQQGEDGNIHVHVAMGTNTTLRHDDLPAFRHIAYDMEQHLRQQITLQMTQQQREAEQQRQQAEAQREAQLQEARQPRTEPPNLDLRDLKPDVQQQEQAQLKAQRDDQNEGKAGKSSSAGGREIEGEEQQKPKKQREWGRDWGY